MNQSQINKKRRKKQTATIMLQSGKKDSQQYNKKIWFPPSDPLCKP